MAGIFKKNDIRGTFGTSLTPMLVFKIGYALGKILGAGSEIAIAGDSRLSTPEVKKMMSKGLNLSGCKTFDLGLGPTPMIYFAASYFENITAGVVITASHNPKPDNGIKVCDATGAAFHYGNLYGQLEDDIEHVQDELESSQVEGMNVDGSKMADAYYAYLQSKFTFTHSISLCVEFGNGAAGKFLSVLDALNCVSTPLREDPNGNFPTILPDPTKPSTYERIQETFAKGDIDYDIGIAFDGDGDRVGFILPTGEILSPDQITMLYGIAVLGKKQQAKILIDVKISKATADHLKALGAEVILTQVGHSWVHENLIKEKADIAAELSGHYYFQDEYFGYDDGLYAALRLLRIVDVMKNDGTSISEQIQALPKYFPSPEYRDKIPHEKQDQILKNLELFVKENKGKVVDIDGIRGEFSDSWFIARKSGTEEVLSYRIEGKTPQACDSLKNKVMQIINQT